MRRNLLIIASILTLIALAQDYEHQQQIELPESSIRVNVNTPDYTPLPTDDQDDHDEVIDLSSDEGRAILKDIVQQAVNQRDDQQEDDERQERLTQTLLSALIPTLLSPATQESTHEEKSILQDVIKKLMDNDDEGNNDLESNTQVQKPSKNDNPGKEEIADDLASSVISHLVGANMVQKNCDGPVEECETVVVQPPGNCECTEEKPCTCDDRFVDAYERGREGAMNETTPVVEKLREEVATLKKDLDVRVETENTKIKEAANQAKEEAKLELDQLRDQQQKELTRKEEERRQLEQEIKKQMLDQAQKEKEQAELKKTLEEKHEKKLKKTQDMLNSIRETLKRQKALVSQRTFDMRVAEAKLKDAVDKAEQEGEDIVELKKKLNSTRTNLKGLEQHETDLEDQISVVDKKLGEAENEITTLKTRNEELKKTLENKENTIKNMKARMASMRGQRFRWKSAMRSLSTRLNREKSAREGLVRAYR